LLVGGVEMKNPTLDLEVDFKILATGESIKLSPISSQIEKSALEAQAIQEDGRIAFDHICKLYGVPDNLSEDLKLACLLKVREISNGSDCQLKYKCPKCNRVTESIIMLEDMLDFSLFDKIERFRDVKLKDVTELNLDPESIKMSEVFDYFEQRPELKNLEDVKDLTLSLKARFPKFKHTMYSRCILCDFENLVNVDRQFVVKALSTHSIAAMYQVYHKLVINGFTKLDVDSMLPFEREIQSGLIDQAVQQLKQAREGNKQSN
jgi:hypothetical protein